jgi:prepilin-type N-terminal cleavage/methylation domain-containing protein
VTGSPRSRGRGGRGGRGGFTLLELMIALIIGLVVLASAMAVTAGTWRSVRGVTIRDGVVRNARYIGVSLQRDVQETGVDLSSAPDFGSLATFGDTIAILRVPYTPAAAPQYALSTANFANGVCGAACLEIQTGGVAPSLSVGDVARLQVSNSRRLLYITSVAAVAGGYRIQFVNAPRLLHHAAAIQGLAVTAAGSFVQQLGLVVYYKSGLQLMRATRLSAALAPQGDPIASGMQAFTARLVFTDNAVVAQADSGSDGSAVNDYDDIAALQVQATIQGDRTDPRVNNGLPVTKQLQWWFAPRNLIYERNRA